MENETNVQKKTSHKTLTGCECALIRNISVSVLHFFYKEQWLFKAPCMTQQNVLKPRCKALSLINLIQSCIQKAY